MTPQHGEGSTPMNDDSYAASSLDEPKNETPFVQQAPFVILNKFGSLSKRSRQGKVIEAAAAASSASYCAKIRLEQHTSQGNVDRHGCVLFSGSSSSENIKAVELTTSLLDAATLFSKHQFDCAEKLLRKCILLCSMSDDPLRRVVRYFAMALKERIDLERGKIDLEKTTCHSEDCLIEHQPAIVAAVRNLPSPQIVQFTAIQAILDSIGAAKKVHLVDFGIASGMHGSVMMQGLANRKSCPLELLKITAIGKVKDRLQETGKRLTSFAESMNLPFVYKSVVSETELREGSIELDSDEVVAVYFGLYLWTHLVWPNHLRAFIQFIKKLNPCVVVVNEFEASINDSILIDRFHGAFTYMTAMFDCVDTCLTGDDVKYRKILEELLFWNGIRNVITAEDEERSYRHAKIEFWRLVFGELGFVETDFSASSLYQANLLININESWNSCNLVMDGKSMIVGWKGTPLQSISAWKIADWKSQQDMD